MEKQPKIIAEEIHLLKIVVVANTIDVVAFKEAKAPRLEIAHKLMHNLQDEMLKIELIFAFKNRKEEQLMLLQTDYHFRIEKLETFYKLKEEQPTFFAPLIATILGISISTSRGIVFEKLENNSIRNFIVPVISPQNILTKSQ